MVKSTQIRSQRSSVETNCSTDATRVANIKHPTQIQNYKHSSDLRPFLASKEPGLPVAGQQPARRKSQRTQPEAQGKEQKALTQKGGFCAVQKEVSALTTTSETSDSGVQQAASRLADAADKQLPQKPSPRSRRGSNLGPALRPLASVAEVVEPDCGSGARKKESEGRKTIRDTEEGSPINEMGAPTNLKGCHESVGPGSGDLGQILKTHGLQKQQQQNSIITLINKITKPQLSLHQKIKIKPPLTTHLSQGFKLFQASQKPKDDILDHPELQALAEEKERLLDNLRYRSVGLSTSLEATVKAPTPISEDDIVAPKKPSKMPRVLQIFNGVQDVEQVDFKEENEKFKTYQALQKVKQQYDKKLKQLRAKAVAPNRSRRAKKSETNLSKASKPPGKKLKSKPLAKIYPTYSEANPWVFYRIRKDLKERSLRRMKEYRQVVLRRIDQYKAKKEAEMKVAKERHERRMEANRKMKLAPTASAKAPKRKIALYLAAQAVLKKPLSEFRKIVEVPENTGEPEESLIPAGAQSRVKRWSQRELSSLKLGMALYGDKNWTKLEQFLVKKESSKGIRKPRYTYRSIKAIQSKIYQLKTESDLNPFVSSSRLEEPSSPKVSTIQWTNSSGSDFGEIQYSSLKGSAPKVPEPPMQPQALFQVVKARKLGEYDPSFEARPLEFRDSFYYGDQLEVPKQIFRIHRFERHHQSDYSRALPLQPFQTSKQEAGTPKKDLQYSKEDPMMPPHADSKQTCLYPTVMSPQMLPPYKRTGNKIFICHKAMPGQTSQDDSRIREQRLEHQYCEEWGINCAAHSHNTHASKDTDCPLVEEYKV